MDYKEIPIEVWVAGYLFCYVLTYIALHIVVHFTEGKWTNLDRLLALGFSWLVPFVWFVGILAGCILLIVGINKLINDEKFKEWLSKPASW